MKPLAGSRAVLNLTCRMAGQFFSALLVGPPADVTKLETPYGDDHCHFGRLNPRRAHLALVLRLTEIQRNIIAAMCCTEGSQ